MTDSFKKLIEVAFDIKLFFQVANYTLYQYEDGSYVEFRVRKVKDLPKLLELSQGLEVYLYESEGVIVVRIYENPFEL